MKNFACLVVLVCVCGCGMSSQDYRDYKTALDIRDYEYKDYNDLLLWLNNSTEMKDLNQKVKSGVYSEQTLKSGQWGPNRFFTKEDRLKLQERIQDGKESKERIDELTTKWLTRTAEQSERLEIARERVRKFREQIK